MPYLGRSSDGFGVRDRFVYTASGSETSLSGADDNSRTLKFQDGTYVDVYLNGVLLLRDTDYVTTTTNTIGSLASLAANDIVEVVVYDVFTVSDTVSKTSGGSFGGAISVNGNITAGGALSGVTTLTTTSTATIGGATTISGDTAISGNLRSDSSADGIQIDATNDSAGNAGDLILLDGTDGSATNAGSSLLYEDGTGDPANYFNNNAKFSSNVEIGGDVTSVNTITSGIITAPSIRKTSSTPTFTIPAADGDDGQAIITNGSGTLSFGDAGGGKILQVVHTQKNESFETTSSTFVVITGLTANITPSATSSKILIMMSAPYSSTANAGQISIFKGGSNLLDSLRGSNLGSRTACTTSAGNPESGADEQMNNNSFSIIDSPSSTSQLTYDIRVRGNGSTMIINGNHNPDNIQQRPCSISSITLMEIDGS